MLRFYHNIMGWWGYHSDENDDTLEYLYELETLYDYNKDETDDSNREDFRDFTKLIDVDELRKYKYESIIGVLVNYTRRDTLDIPKKLPKGYPESYKKLAKETFNKLTIDINLYGDFREPKKRYDALLKEKKLFCQ